MSKSTTPDEKPKKAVASSVVTEKRRYYFTNEQTSVEADDLASATAQLTKQRTKKVGDGNS